MAWLPDGEKSLKISLFVLAQLTNVTDDQTDGRTPDAGNSRAYPSIPFINTHKAAVIIKYKKYNEQKNIQKE